jgi:cobyrinic acid a,c-diamide synthase
MTHGLIVAGTHSGVGKTTITIALMAALRRRGLTVQGFKVGPDFIDPGFHAAATGRPSYNLDGWMLDRDTNRKIFARAAAEADVAVVEGMMGLFDGASGSDESGSTAEIAKLLGLPVVLVIDAAAQARSAAALVHGFETFDLDLLLVAVIANSVAGEGHYLYIKDAINASCRAELVGWLPRNPAVAMPSRHLGLVTACDVVDAARLEVLADWIESGIDLDRLLGLSVTHTVWEAAAEGGEVRLVGAANDPRRASEVSVRIGLARDRAFCFYYQDNLALLQRLGAELVSWSPIDDPLPDGLQGLYFGGGYPELYATQLTANVDARRAVGAFVAGGGAVYAECGGLMYLTEAIVDADGAEYPMVGILPTRARIRGRLVALAYAEVEGLDDALLPPGQTARGHQFRYSEIDPMPGSIARRYRVRVRRRGDTPHLEGYSVHNCLASYIHLHFLSNPGFAARWLYSCRRSNVITQAKQERITASHAGINTRGQLKVECPDPRNRTAHKPSSENMRR